MVTSLSLGNKFLQKWMIKFKSFTCPWWVCEIVFCYRAIWGCFVTCAPDSLFYCLYWCCSKILLFMCAILNNCNAFAHHS